MLARVPWFKVSQSNASARWCPSCHPCSRQCRSTEEIISKARPILEAGDTEIVGDYSDDATGKRCFRRRVGGARQHDERNIVYTEQCTVEPSRVVLGSAQLLSTTHRPVHRSVTTGEVSHRGAIVVAVCRHHVAGVLTRSVRTLGRTSDPALHVA